jgi:hypothetical protein
MFGIRVVRVLRPVRPAPGHMRNQLRHAAQLTCAAAIRANVPWRTLT